MKAGALHRVVQRPLGLQKALHVLRLLRRRGQCVVPHDIEPEKRGFGDLSGPVCVRLDAKDPDAQLVLERVKFGCSGSIPKLYSSDPGLHTGTEQGLLLGGHTAGGTGNVGNGQRWGKAGEVDTPGRGR